MRNIDLKEKELNEQLEKKIKEQQEKFQTEKEIYAFLNEKQLYSNIEPKFVMEKGYQRDAGIFFEVENFIVLKEILKKIPCNVNRKYVKTSTTSLKPFLGPQDKDCINGYVIRTGEWDTKLEYYHYFRGKLYEIQITLKLNDGIMQQAHHKHVGGEVYEKTNCRLVLSANFKKLQTREIRWSRGDKKYFNDFTIYFPTVNNTQDIMEILYDLSNQKDIAELSLEEKINLYKDDRYVRELLQEKLGWFEEFEWSIYAKQSYDDFIKSEIYLQTPKGSLHVPVEALMNKDIKAVMKRNLSYHKSYHTESGYSLNKRGKETNEEFKQRNYERYKKIFDVFKTPEVVKFIKYMKG